MDEWVSYKEKLCQSSSCWPTAECCSQVSREGRAFRHIGYFYNHTVHFLFTIWRKIHCAVKFAMKLCQLCTCYVENSLIKIRFSHLFSPFPLEEDQITLHMSSHQKSESLIQSKSCSPNWWCRLSTKFLQRGTIQITELDKKATSWNHQQKWHKMESGVFMFCFWKDFLFTG